MHATPRTAVPAKHIRYAYAFALSCTSTLARASKWNAAHVHARL